MSSQAPRQAGQNERMQQCIESCLENFRVGTETITYCLEKGGKHAAPEHIQALTGSAEMSRTSAAFMLRNDPLHKQVCGVTAEACERCAEHCERMAEGDEQMRRCAEVARRCAESCRQMSSAA